MSDYLRRLRAHPGVMIATVFSVSCAVVLHRDGWLVVFVASALVWAPVLITARTQPLPGERDE